jgi:hypothetical protein
MKAITLVALGSISIANAVYTLEKDFNATASPPLTVSPSPQI